MKLTVAVLGLFVLVVAAIGIVRLPWDELLQTGVDRAPAPSRGASWVVSEDQPGPRRRALRLLVAGQYDELTRAFEDAQRLAERDPSREPEIGLLVDAFDTANPDLTPRLDRWVETTPDSFAPYLARARHRSALAFDARGEKWAKDTTSEQFARMRQLLVGVSTDADAAVARHPNLPEAHARRIVVAMASGDTAECLRIGHEALALAPASARVRMAMARCLLPRWGGSWTAIEMLARQAGPHLGRNPALAPLSGFADWDRGATFANQKRDDEARLYFDRAIAAGDHWDFRDSRARLNLRQDMDQRALADAERGLELSPEHPTLLLLRARALLRLGRRSEAAADVRVARELDPTSDALARLVRHEVDTAAYEAWERIQAKTGVDEAIARLTFALELAGPNPKALAWRGRAQAAEGDRDAALRDLDAAIEADPHYYDAYVTADWLLASQGQWDAILRRWNRLLALEPTNAEALLERAGAHKHAGDLAAARADVTQACDLGLRKACQIAGRL